MKKYCVAVLACAFAMGQAQEQDKEIEPVTIAGRVLQLPYKTATVNIEVISRDEILRSAANSIEEVLSNTAGIDIRRRGPQGLQSDLGIRGSSFDQVLLLVNGVRMKDAQTGHNMMNVPFDLASVERIEIIKGPAARRFGTDAYGGVVNIVTKAAGDDTFMTGASGGDFGSWSLTAGADLGKPEAAHYFQAHSAGAEGYRYNTDYRADNYWYQNRFIVGKGELTMQGGFGQKKFGANGFYASPSAKDQYEETHISLASASYNVQVNRLDINAGIYWRRAQDMYLFVRSNPAAYRNMHIGNNIGGNVNVGINSKIGLTTVGADVRQENLRSNNLGKHERLITQLFIDQHLSFFDDKLQLVPGIAWTHYPGIGNYFLPGLDAGFSLSNQHKFFANASKVNRLPTYTDLFYLSKTEQGNPALEPEKALSYEIGYRFSYCDFRLEASYFGRDSENLIDWVKERPDALWTAENRGKINTRGVEAEVQYRFNGIIDGLAVGYTYLNSSYKDDGRLSRYALDNLKHQLITKLDNKFGDFRSRLTYRYSDRVTLKDYHLLDLKLSYRHKNTEIYTLVNNMTNTQYTETNLVPMPGRWFHVGFTFRGKF